MATYDEIVFDKVKRTFSLSEDHYYGFADFENFVQQLKFGLNTAFPYVVLKENNEYSLCDNQNGMDLKNEIRVHSDMLVDIVSLDVDEMIRLEDTTKSSFTTPQSLAIGGERCVSGAKVFIDTARQIVRCNGAAPNGAMYESDIPMKITDIILPKNVVNPIKVELDGNAQRGLMKHLSLLDDYALLLENKMNDILNTEQLKAYSTKDEKIAHLSFDSKLKYKYYSQMYSNVEQQVTDMYTFENLCKEKILLSDHGFKMCYNIMLEDNCDIKAASAKYAEKRKKAIRAEQRTQRAKLEREKMFSTAGDAAINLYADAVVSDIESKLQLNYSISVYGGSTAAKYFLLNERGTLNFPNVFVQTTSHFYFDNKMYLNIDSNGRNVTRAYSTDILPIHLGFVVFVLSNQQSQVNEIINQLRQIYSGQVVIAVPDPVFNGEKCAVRLEIEATDNSGDFDIMKNVKSQTAIYSSAIVFKKFMSAYYTQCCDLSDIKYNIRLQFRILQRIEFLMLCDSYLRFKTANSLNNYYKELFNKKSLLNRMFEYDNLKKSDDYKKLQSMIQNRQMIDREFFNKVLLIIVQEYPPLFDRMIQGWSIEQIQADMLKYADIFNREWNALLKNLVDIACPKIYSQLNLSHNGLDGAVEIIHAGILYYINEMALDFYCTLEDAVGAYWFRLAEEQERQRREMERQREINEQRMLERMEREHFDNSNSRSRGGFIRQLSDNEFNKERPIDLLGSPGCLKSKGGECRKCNLRDKCTRYGINGVFSSLYDD